ncbi:MAG: hypothetical protein EXR95_08915 [Gemmatimonadetes bacterium]|nr:hypothetical protein [Gemmatimonadota bacterium]
MKNVSISQLKAGLSRDADRDRLIEAGVLRPGSGDASSILSEPPLKLSTSLVDALDEDREDRF